MLKGDCNICINGNMPSYSASCVECGLSRKNYKPMTNGDLVRQMSDEELARYYAKRIARCYGCEAVTEDDCFECQMYWLKAPAKEGE